MRTLLLPFWLVVLLVWVVSLGGCATTRPYREPHPENLTFSSPGLAGSILGSPRIYLHFYYADRGPDEKGCELDYRGTVSLSPGDGSQRVGLSTEREVYARIFVRQSDWLRNSTKTRKDEFRLRARRGHSYDLEYVHKKKFYGRRITDTDARGRTREIQPADWGSCRLPA